jgi:hypothetical protein
MDLQAMHLLGGGPGFGCKANPRMQLQANTKWHKSAAATELAYSNQLEYRVCCCDYERSHAGKELLRNHGTEVAPAWRDPSCSHHLVFSLVEPRICVTFACPSHMRMPKVLPDFTFWSRMHAQTEGSAPHTLHKNVPQSNVHAHHLVKYCVATAAISKEILPLQLPWILHQRKSAQ